MKASIDPDDCVGCGLCPEACPEVLEMQDDGKADPVPHAAEAACRAAAEPCPVEAITIE